MSSIRIEINDNGVDRELIRLADGPDQKDLLRLESANAETFHETQTVVHRVTGRLAATGRPHTAYRRTTKEWIGEIRYGGGVVDYAEYEYDLGRQHPVHDFLRPAKENPYRVTEAIEEFLDGRR